METYISESASDTARLGKDFAKRLIKGKNQGSTSNEALILALYGDLGSGKTTFVQGLARGLGITKRIISPTFVIVRQYSLPFYSSSEVRQLADESRSNKLERSRQARTINFYHIDLYRIESQRDLEGLGLEEILKDPNSVVAIEWAEKLGDLLPKQRIDISFEYMDEERRKLSIKQLKF